MVPCAFSVITADSGSERYRSLIGACVALSASLSMTSLPLPHIPAPLMIASKARLLEASSHPPASTRRSSASKASERGLAPVQAASIISMRRPFVDITTSLEPSATASLPQLSQPEPSASMSPEGVQSRGAYSAENLVAEEAPGSQWRSAAFGSRTVRLGALVGIVGAGGAGTATILALRSAGSG